MLLLAQVGEFVRPTIDFHGFAPEFVLVGTIVLMWVAAVLSAAIDNIRFTAAMIPILMKQPEKPNDRDHQVKRIVTSACPAELWEKFEHRFGIEIWEGYGAVDGGGVLIMNIGNAPKGSIGKPLGSKIRVVTDDGNDAGAGPAMRCGLVSPAIKLKPAATLSPAATSGIGPWEKIR